MSLHAITSCSSIRRASKRESGVTLIELLISIVIISIAMIAVLNAFSYSMGHSADPLWRNKSIKLAQLYLDEILSKAYDDSTPLGGTPPVASPSCTLGPEAGETRSNYDDVDDFDGLSDKPPVSVVGGLDASYAGYQVDVSVQCDGSSVSATANNQAKRVTVTITPPGQTAMKFSAYRGNF